MNVKFLLKNPKDGKNTIHMRVRNGRKTDLSINTRQTCNLEDWDAENGFLVTKYQVLRDGKMITPSDAVTKNKVEANKDINYKLLEYQKTVEKDYSDNPNTQHDSEWLTTLLFPPAPDTSKSDMTILEYMDIFFENKGSTISPAYVTKVKAIKKIIGNYLVARKKHSLKLNEIDNNFKNDFEKFCISEKNYSINYFEKNFKFIKTILYEAESNDYEINQGLRKIKCRSEPTLFQILTPAEIIVLENANFTDEPMKTARDWLLISCFTAQRLSDMKKFKPEMVSTKLIDGKERYFIEFVQQKTKQQVLFPLDKRVIKIMKERDWNFPRPMSDTRYNLMIKKVCEYAGLTEVVEGDLYLDENGDENEEKKKKKSTTSTYRKQRGFYPKWKLVSSHIGRRSFASNNYGIIPTPLILRVTGHKDQKMLMNYIGKIEETQSLALANYID